MGPRAHTHRQTHAFPPVAPSLPLRRVRRRARPRRVCVEPRAHRQRVGDAGGACRARESVGWQRLMRAGGRRARVCTQWGRQGRATHALRAAKAAQADVKRGAIAATGPQSSSRAGGCAGDPLGDCRVLGALRGTPGYSRTQGHSEVLPGTRKLRGTQGTQNSGVFGHSRVPIGYSGYSGGLRTPACQRRGATDRPQPSRRRRARPTAIRRRAPHTQR